MATREYYFLKTSQHVLNEHLYVLKGKDFMVQQLVVDIMVIKKIPCLVSIHISYVFSK